MALRIGHFVFRIVKSVGYSAHIDNFFFFFVVGGHSPNLFVLNCQANGGLLHSKKVFELGNSAVSCIHVNKVWPEEMTLFKKPT